MIPPELLSAVGNPPPFAVVVAPLQHTVSFPSGEVISYSDHKSIGSPRYAYYRFDEGVAHAGLALRDWARGDLEALFAQAGFSRFEQNVVRAVSRLEGGFESVNTYDTGFVSVGFIQFASLEEGRGSLGPVLRRLKRERPADFERLFRAFGIDVDEAAFLVVIDPSTGAEARGSEANRAIINDKRLIAVFQRAGAATPFRLAQIAAAKERFYPTDRELVVNVVGREVKGRLSDVIRSEAGMATLFDRSVNLGNFRLLAAEVEKLMRERGLSSFEQVRPFERELVKRLKWRHDFLADATLSQPR